MENSSQSERKKSVLGAITASKLTEMLKNIDISSIKEANGGYNARARILALFDMGTFAETGAYIVRQNAGDDPSNAFEGVITGYGAIDGRLVYAFVQDSSIELSADGPIRPPYAVYFQGGLTWNHAKIGILMSLQKMADAGLVTL